ncbi:hypothetical protein HJG54_20665 [Leptolyngbya sp. NK1-12]|uniref:HAD family hydrolase n=1 Tax=Leptolyngbya sp. NK1-12 TaxID=2547451 RepID=A0AA96WI15_9CYAN|nr:hypothetical protein HJG54_20665 [Leptolyngbya sp. NK1-12]
MKDTRESRNLTTPQSSITFCQQSTSTNILFDWRFYTEYYEDLGTLSSYEEAHEHWILFGQLEGRFPNSRALQQYFEHKQPELPLDFNFEKYLELNPDLQQRFNRHRYRQLKATEHFLQHGKQEGRVYLSKQLHQLQEQSSSLQMRTKLERQSANAENLCFRQRQLEQEPSVFWETGSSDQSNCNSNSNQQTRLPLLSFVDAKKVTCPSNFENLIAADSFFQSVASKLAAPEIKAVSFDFFDTLVYRDVIVPTCAFYLTGLRLQEKGMLPVGIDAKRFHDLRILAETNARQRLSEDLKTSEVRLAEIYIQFPQGFFGAAGWKEAMKMELVVEDSIIHPYLPLVELVQQAIQLGKKVVITSDTYFSAEQLRGFLLGKVDLKFLQIFSSSDQRTGKSDQLFDAVLQELNIAPHQLLHIGDNYLSDITTPSTLGIQTGFLPNGTSEIWQIIADEVQSNQEILDYIDPHRGDQGITSFRTKLLNLSSPQSQYWRYGATNLGPVFHGFIRWVLSLQTQISVETSLFLMREGEFLLQLVSQLETTDQTESTEQSRYQNQLAYLSRRVVRQAALYKIDRSGLESLMSGRKLPNTREFLSLIGLDASDLGKHTHLIEASLAEVSVKEQLLDFILGQPRLCQKILTQAALKRARLMAHLRSVLPAEAFDGSRQSSYRVGLVDIGWNGSIQRYLQQIIHQEGYKIDFFGFYLMTTASIKELTMQGIKAYGFLADSGRPCQEHQWMMRTVEILEQSCTAAIGSLVDYTASGQPVIGHCMIPPAQLAQIREIQQGILAFHTIAALHIQQLELTDTLKSLLRRVLFRSVCHPTIDEVQLLQAWQHDENLVQQTAETLVSGDIIKFVSHMTPRQFLALPMSEIYWPYGLAVVQSPATAGLLQAISQQALKLEATETILPGQANLHLDLGQGFASGSSLSTSLYRNLEGRTYIKLEATQDGIQAICFEPFDLPAILQIDCIQLTYWCHRSNLTHRFTISGSQISSLAQLSGMQAIGATTYCTRKNGQVILDFNLLGIQAVRHIRLEAGMSVMPLDIADTDLSKLAMFAKR